MYTLFFILMIAQPQRLTLFPYTTLFRSCNPCTSLKKMFSFFFFAAAAAAAAVFSVVQILLDMFYKKKVSTFY